MLSPQFCLSCLLLPLLHLSSLGGSDYCCRFCGEVKEDQIRFHISSSPLSALFPSPCRSGDRVAEQGRKILQLLLLLLLLLLLFVTAMKEPANRQIILFPLHQLTLDTCSALISIDLLFSPSSLGLARMFCEGKLSKLREECGWWRSYGWLRRKSKGFQHYKSILSCSEVSRWACLLLSGSFSLSRRHCGFPWRSCLLVSLQFVLFNGIDHGSKSSRPSPVNNSDQLSAEALAH